MEKPERNEVRTKKVYNRPVLRQFGTIQEITQGFGGEVRDKDFATYRGLAS